MCRTGVLAFAIILFAAGAAAKTPLRIMTLNAEWLVSEEGETDKDPWGPPYTLNEHLERIAGIIETLQPDIVNLVEVTTKAGVDRLVAILHEKGSTDYKGFHIESYDNITGQDVGLVSKYTPDVIKGAYIRNFYSTGQHSEWRADYTWKTARGVTKHDHTSISKNAVYCFTIDGHKLGFLGLHLKADPDSAEANGQRTGQSRVAQKIIREEIVARGYIPIVLGDFNDYDPDVPDRDDTCSTKSKVLSYLKDYNTTLRGPELVNAAVKITRVFDRYTSHYDLDDDRVPDEGEPMTMIDHILIHKKLLPAVRRVFIDHGHGGQTSDHWPVIVDLELE
jgi:endonuclease/exonuclease/phosphatase family metal-dependent hydrolase